jgi:hypothetical protein
VYRSALTHHLNSFCRTKDRGCGGKEYALLEPVW